MVCLGLEPGAAIWKEQMNPLSYGGTPLPVLDSIFCTVQDITFPIFGDRTLAAPMKIALLIKLSQPWPLFNFFY